MSSENDKLTSLSDILIVDDNTANLKLLESVLSEAGHKVRLAKSGELSLRSAQTKPPTLILLDIKMPDMDGYEVCRRLKANEKTSGIPIIFITALESESDKVKGFEAGCVDYINKPINKAEVLARVRAHTSLRLAQLAIENHNTSLSNMNKQLETANRLFAFLSEVNQTIVRINDRDDLFHDICRIAVEFGRFRMAWIGLIDSKTETIEPYTFHGYEEGYLVATQAYINDKSSVLIPNQAAVREGKVVICDDIATNPAMLPQHREEALKRGYRSFAAIPLKLRQKVIGTLCIYAGEAGFFSAEESRLLSEIGGDISFALDSFETAKEHESFQEKLADSEVRYRRLFETAQDAILILNGDTGQIIDANPFIKDLLGYSMDELVSKNLWEIGVLKDTLTGKLSYQQLHESGYRRWDNLPFLTRDGRQISVEVVANAYQVDHTRVIQCNIRDMTESNRANEDRQRVAKLESIGILAGGIAHDFNNILTGILGNIQLANGYLDQNKADTAKEMLDEAERSALRAKDLTQQLLTFSKGGVPVKDVVLVNQLIRESATFALRGSAVKPEFVIPDDLWAVEADKGQLNQVIGNIVINANHAMPNGGIINVGASNIVIDKNNSLSLPDGKYIEVTIEDHGIGIPEENKSRIFDPYFTTKQKGSGLGLATSYSITKNHGGCITFESALGVGTTFHIYIPASADKIQEEKTQAPKTPQVPLTHERILIMDDEDTILLLLGRLLKSAGYEVELTRDGYETVRKYTEAKESGKPFAAVILDLTVPGGLGGKEVIAQLLEIDPEVKAIVSSGYATDPIMAEFKKYGFSGVVAKPYNIGHMQETLRDVLAGK